MNHTLSLEDFRCLVRGQIVTLSNGDQIALADVGWAEIGITVANAMHDLVDRVPRDAHARTGGQYLTPEQKRARLKEIEGKYSSKAGATIEEWLEAARLERELRG